MTESNQRSIRKKARRRGLASVSVLVVLFVVGLICAGMIKLAFSRRTELSMDERRVQAAWLAESGVDRAVARLQASSEYSGETWNITSDELGGRGGASLLIQIEKVPDQSDRRKVRVQADYPVESSHRARESRELIVPIKSSSR